MRKKRRNNGVGRSTTYVLAVLLFGASLTYAVLTHAAATAGISSPPAWANPVAMTIRQTNALGSAQTEPNFLSNLDCQLVSYRLTTSSTQQSGCFSDAAFGLVDTDSDMTIFSGTDEALPLLPYSAHQVLVPWPGTLDVLTLDAADTGGSYINLYRDIYGSLKDVRNGLGQLSGKQVTRPPETRLSDSSGRPLIVNAQTLAFSGSHSWLVADTLGGSFVRINLATLDMLPFAPSFGMTGSPALLRSQVAVSDDGRFVAIENNAASSFKVYDLATCSGSASGSQPENCRSYDYWQFARQQIAGLQSVRHVRFLNEGLLGFEAVTSSGANGSYLLAPADGITSLTDYIGLGDSYTSGEGAFDYLQGTDTTGNMCHLSARSYPLLLTRDLFSTAGGHSVACSGAVINDVGSNSDNYRGQVRGVADFKELREGQSDLLASVETNFLPGYIAQHRFVKQYQPVSLTVSVGGDDIGFGDILKRCVEPHLSLHLSDETCFNTYEDRMEVRQLIDRTTPRWTALYRQLRSESPQTRIYAIGYPEIADDTGNCALNVHLSKSELEFSDELVDYLNNAVMQAAAKAGVTYVDISKALVGHRLCEAPSYDIAMNGLTAGTDAGPFVFKILGRESYHPNALGQTLIEQAILKQTHNLTAATSSSTGDADNSQRLLDAPKTGRKTSQLLPESSLTSGVAGRGSSIELSAEGVKNGLQPNQTYTIHLDGPGGIVIGTTVSGADGDLSATVPIPGNTEPGGHTIDVTGDNQDDEPVDITQPIYVTANGDDADGDGIPNASDSCPGAVNSGEDIDQDGIDDTCDGLIGAAPAGDDSGGGGAEVASSSSGGSQGAGDSNAAGNGPSGSGGATIGSSSDTDLQGAGSDSGNAVQGSSGAGLSDGVGGSPAGNLALKPRAAAPGRVMGLGVHTTSKLSPGSHPAAARHKAVAMRWPSFKVSNLLVWLVALNILLLLLLLWWRWRRSSKRIYRQTGYV